MCADSQPHPQNHPQIDAGFASWKPHASAGGHDGGMQNPTDRDEPEDDNPDALRPFRLCLADALEAAAKAVEENAGSDDR